MYWDPETNIFLSAFQRLNPNSRDQDKRTEGTKKLRRREERRVKVENSGVWGLIATEIKIESGWRWCLDEGRPLTSQAPHSPSSGGPLEREGPDRKTIWLSSLLYLFDWGSTATEGFFACVTPCR